MRIRTPGALALGAIALVSGLLVLFLLLKGPRPREIATGGGNETAAEGAATPAAREAHLGLQIGDITPDFALAALDGSRVRLSDFRGTGVVLNFWASWCGPCRAEMPDLEAVYQAHRDEMVVVGVNLQEDRETILEFLKEIPVSYPLLLDRQGEVARLYELRTQPVTYFIAPDGRILSRKFGAFTRKELERRVNEFLAEGRASPGTERENGVEILEAEASKLTYFSESEMNRFLKTAQEADLDPNRVPYVADLDRKLLKLGCPFVDCIPSIDGPEFESPAEADRWLRPDDLVLGLALEGVTKAYPLKILNWHEIVNDVFGKTPVVVTYCPLCNSGVAFRREVDGKTLEFGVSGRLYKSDLVMYDRATGTFWSQLEGRAIVGPLAGRTLERLPLDVLPWRAWRELHPDTLVLARPTVHTRVGGVAPLAERRAQARSSAGSSGPKPIGDKTQAGGGEFLRNYEEDPYAWYRTNNYDTFGTPFQDRRLKAKAAVWGIALEGGAAKAYAEPALQTKGLINDEIGGVPVLVLWTGGTARAFRRELPSGRVVSFARGGDETALMDRETGSRWDRTGRAIDGPLRGTRLEAIPVIKSFWFAWAAFHPSTGLFATTETEGGSGEERQGDGG